jgi:rare lipoprotein A
VILVAIGVWQAVAAQEPGRSQPQDTTPPAARSTETTGSNTGLAAVYSDRLHGRKTASGQRYDRNKLTAAHQTLPFGTRVKITNPKNKKTVTVRINDRGPTQAGRILDISPAVAKRLGIKPKAMAQVHMEVVQKATPKRHAR